LPLWPVLMCICFVAAGIGVAYATRNRSAGTRFAHLFDAFRALGREPGRGARITGWIALSTLARLSAAAGIAAALGVRGPGAAAVVGAFSATVIPGVV